MSLAVLVSSAGALLLVQGHPIIRPVPDSVIVVAAEDNHRVMTVVYRDDDRRARREIAGRYWNLEYDVAGGLAREKISEHFVAESERLNGVIHREAGNRLTFTVMREDGGETWCQVWATDGNYALEIVDEAPPTHQPFDDTVRPAATIVFARGEATFDGGADAVLDAIAGWLEAHPRARAEVRGHRGPLEDPALVEERAVAVAAAIVNRGISEERLSLAEDPSNQGFEVTVAAVEP